MEPTKRDTLCRYIGLSSIFVFLVVGSILANSQPVTEESPPFLFRLLNQNKYPASQGYLLMTLGPLILLIPYAEKAKGRVAKFLSVFGRVPLFYYLLHILVIHVSALVVMSLTQSLISSDVYATAPFTFLPEENRWSLFLLYGVFLVDVIILYFLCKWYAGFKKQHPAGLLKYI